MKYQLLLLKALLWVFFVIAVFACNNQNTTSVQKNKIWKGQSAIFIKDSSESIPALYSLDSLGSGHPPILFKQDTTKIQINAPHWFLSLSNWQTPFLIYPGDTVHISMNKYYKVFLKIKDDKQKNNQLTIFPKMIAKTGVLYNGYEDSFHKKEKKLSEVLASNNAIIEKKKNCLQMLDTAWQQKDIDSFFYQSAKSVIQYAAIINKLSVLDANRNILSQANLYKKMFDSCLNEAKTLPFSVNYMSSHLYPLLVSMGVNNSLRTEISDINDLSKRISFAMKNFNGLQKDFLLSNFISTSILFYHINVPQSIIHQYDTACIDTSYKTLVHKIIKEQAVQTLNVKKDNELLLSDNKTTKSLQEIFSANKGKLILLDFWASWCAPCRKEIPYLKLLEEKYATNNIVFYSISIDSKVNDWKTAMKEEGIVNNTNWLLLNAEKASFVKQNNINTIPRYLVIGKDGKMINADAPRPSDPKLKELIEKNL